MPIIKYVFSVGVDIAIISTMYLYHFTLPLAVQFLKMKTSHPSCLGDQSVKHLTVEFNSGFDLRVVNSSPTLGSMLGTKYT